MKWEFPRAVVAVVVVVGKGVVQKGEEQPARQTDAESMV